MAATVTRPAPNDPIPDDLLAEYEAANRDELYWRRAVVELQPLEDVLVALESTALDDATDRYGEASARLTRAERAIDAWRAGEVAGG